MENQLNDFVEIVQLFDIKQARKSSEDTQVAGYTRFEKALAG